MDLRFLFFYLLIGLFILSTHQLADDDSTSDEGDDPKEVEKTLMRALELHRQSMSQSSSRSTRHKTSPQDKGARKILDSFRQASTSFQEEPDAEPAKDDIDLDPDYVPEVIYVAGHPVDIKTMKNIIELHDKGRKEYQIQKQYRWYHRGLLKRFRECVGRGYNRSEIYRLLRENVYKRFIESRDR